MSYQEKKHITSIFTSAFFIIVYSMYLVQQYQSGILEKIDSFSYWAYIVIIILGVKIGFNIFVQIVFNIAHALITKEKQPSIVDELDNLIELRSLKYAFITFMLGFLMAMFSAANGMPIYVMFNLLILSFFAAELVGPSTQVYYYRRGI